MDKRLWGVLGDSGAVGRGHPMLQMLHIQDFAIIDELTVDFHPGLTVMTGETGAGKTILVEALKLALGERAQSDLVRAGSDRASVTAVFDARSMAAPLREELEASGVAVGDELVVTRVIASRGRNRVAVNGMPVAQSVLKRVAEALVDVSSQHEHQRLLDAACHAEIVDAFGGLAEELAAYRTAHERCAALAREVQGLLEREKDAAERLDFLKFQRDEIARIDPRSGEDAELAAERNRAKHAVMLEERARKAEAILYSDAASALEGIDAALIALGECRDVEPRVGDWCMALDRARAEIEETARELARYADGLESDPTRLEEIEERLHLLRTLMRKHGGSLEACLERRAAIDGEIDAVERSDELLAEKEAALEEAAQQRRAAADRLSGARRKTAEALARAVVRELAELGMKRTRFAVEIERREETAWDETGPDAIAFLFSPNVGEPMKPLARIASGGELSRVMLALKGALADRAQLAATSIFDEVDAGIGGAIAEVVGRKLQAVSRARQVICITHLPQVAVYGDHHLRIAKGVKGGRTITGLSPVAEGARLEEIARMLGGERLTATAREHAQEMLAAAQNAASTTGRGR